MQDQESPFGQHENFARAEGASTESSVECVSV